MIEDSNNKIIYSTAMDLIISFIPYLGTAYNSIVGTNIKRRLEVLENQIVAKEIDLEKLKSFLETDSGYSFFVHFCRSIVEAESMQKITIFVEILKDNYENIVPLDVQYKSIILKTISSMSDIEMLALFYIKKYFSEVQESVRLKLTDAEYMEFFCGVLEGQEENVTFSNFLSNQPNGDIIITEFEFLFLRLVSLGIIYRGRRIGVSYYVSGFGKQLIKYIDSYAI